MLAEFLRNLALLRWSDLSFHWRVRAHVRIALQSSTATVLVAAPFISCLVAAWLHSVEVLVASLSCWMALLLMKLWQGTRPSAFPSGIRQSFEDAVAATAKPDHHEGGRGGRGGNVAATPGQAAVMARGGGGKSRGGRESSPPSDLTRDELGLLRFLESVTVGLTTEQRDAIWSMRGGQSQQAQLGFTSIRYHLAFAGYAASVTLSRCPAYTGRLREMLDSLIAHMLDERVWSYLDHYWPDCKDPFLWEENVMWSAHVLQLSVLYEAALGDNRYRRPGGLVASRHDPETGEILVYSSDVTTLALRLVQSMQNNPTGGVPCEPSLVFFQCNNHLMIALKLLENLTAHLPEGDGRLDFRAERRNWERRALNSLSTSGAVATGAFKMLSVSKQGASAEV